MVYRGSVFRDAICAPLSQYIAVYIALFYILFLFTKGKGRLVPWLFFTIIAGALLFLIVIEPNLAALDLTVLGKGGRYDREISTSLISD